MKPALTNQEFNDLIAEAANPEVRRFLAWMYPPVYRASGGRVSSIKPYVKPTPIGPVRGSPYPDIERTEAASTGIPEIDKILNSPVTKEVINNPVVDRSHTIPYTAGGSVPLQDPTMYIDRRFPRKITAASLSKKGKTITFDPARPFVIHENVEQHVMDALVKGGMKDEEAYRIAHFCYAEVAEGAWYKTHDIDQASAEKAYAPFMAKIQKAPANNVPQNLYKRPYPSSHPSLAAGEHIAEAQPSQTEIAKARKIILKDSK